jgi:hypothetical protein
MNHPILNRNIIPPEELNDIPPRMGKGFYIVNSTLDGNFGGFEGTGCEFFGGGSGGGFEAIAEGFGVAAHDLDVMQRGMKGLKPGC